MTTIESATHPAAAAAHRGPRIPQGDDDSQPTAVATEETGDAGITSPVEITLSEEAQAFLEDPGADDRPGRSGQSTAHRARAALEFQEFAALRDLPFGRIVSTLAHFGDLSSLLPQPELVDEAGETDGTDEASEGEDAAAVTTPLDEPSDGTR